VKYDTLIDLILISELTRSNYKLDMSTHIPSTSTDNDNEISLLDSKIRYERILVPHDGSEMSDRALRHAIYLSKISGTEIVILHVIEPTDNILGKRKEELALTTEERIRQMLEVRIKLCKKAGVKEVSYIIRTGRPADEIVRLVGERYYDLIVMASSRISSTIRIILDSNAKKILDSVAKPILVIR
jgi:nucleotide-binding universal stress UspA family protein